MNFTEATPIRDTKPTTPIQGMIIMPERMDNENVGYYGEEASAVYKDLRAMGADVKYYTQKHSGVHRFGAKEEVISFVIGFFISDMPRSVMYDLLKAYVLSKFKKRPKSIVKAKVLITSDINGYSSWQEYEINGSADDAIKMIDKIHDIHSNEHSPGRKKTK